MVLAIDSGWLARYHMKWWGEDLGPRYLVYRACAHATVVNESSLIKRVRCAREVDLATREALEWQADQDEDQDEAEVIHHLHQQAKASPVFENAFSQTERAEAITTLVTSCSVQSPALIASAQGRPLSSFRRLSIRQSGFASPIGICSADVCNLDKIILNAPERKASRFFGAPGIIGEGRSQFKDCVVWHVQLDIVDLRSSRSIPTWRPGKRSRTTVNPFHQVRAPPEQNASPGNHPPEAKRFKGVRYRCERRRWAAEMKPPKYKDKVSFGDFKCQAQAARAIDAAFHYYGKPHLLNFSDTPGILSTRPSPAEDLNEKDKLSFVKEQVKWLASMASTLPSSPPLVPPEIPESSSRGCIGDTVEFRTFSEIASLLSCGVADECDDGISQPLPSLPPDALAELGGHGLMEPPFVRAIAAGSIVCSLDEHQGMFEWNLEDALVAPISSGRWSPGSSLQITDGWDGAEVSGAPALMNLTNSAEPSCESPGSWMNYLSGSPPASMLPLFLGAQLVFMGFRPFSEIASFPSCGVADKSDDAISQALLSDALAEIAGSAWTEPPFVGADASGSIIGASEEHQDMLEWSLEDAFAASSSSGRCWPGSSLQITGKWDVEDEFNDGISQAFFSLHPDALAEFAGSAPTEPPIVGADASGSIIGTSEEHRGMLEWSLEDAFVVSSSSGRRWPGSSVQITDKWDVVEEFDDGVSQALLSLHPDALAESAGSASVEPPFVGADASGSIIGKSEEHQRMLEWSLEDAFVASSSSGRCWPGSSVQITDKWDVVDESSAPALMNLTNSAEPSCESQGSWVNYLSASPPASMLPLLLGGQLVFMSMLRTVCWRAKPLEENGSGADLQRN